MHEENLTQFSLIAADALDALWGVMADQLSATENMADTERTLKRYIELMQRIGEAADNTRMTGLQSACAMVEANLEEIQHEGRVLTHAELDLLATWPEFFLGFVMSQGDSSAGEAMVQHLAQPGWALPLSEADAAVLRHMLFELPHAAPETALLGGAPESATDIMQPPGGNAGEAAEQEIGTEPVSAAEVQFVEGEMLAMLSKEFALMVGSLHEDLASVMSTQLDAGGKHAALQNYSEILGRLGAAAESVGLTALGAVFARLVHSLSAITTEMSHEQHALLELLPERVASYLAWPADESACAELVALLLDTAWSEPVATSAAQTWISALANVEQVASEEFRPERQSEARPEDISLALPDDINAELLDGLLQELPVQTGAFTAAIARLAAGQGSGKDVERAMRAAHTLKGAANTVGVRGIANLTHHLEDILVALSEADAMPGRALSNILTNAGDCLEAMSEALMGVGPQPAQAQAVLQEVLDSANRIDREGIADISAAAMPVARHDVAVQHDEVTQAQGGSETPASSAANVLRVPATVVDEMLRLSGETLISNSQIQERLRITTQQADGIQQQLQTFQQLVGELEHLVDVRGVGTTAHAPGEGEFDPLEFEHFSELHTVTRRLVEAANDAQLMQQQVSEQLDTLEDLLEVQQRLHMDSQHAVMRTRLVPVSSVVSRLQRSVRQTCRLLDKQVTLEIKGENTSIDSNVLNELIDPLMHILRNAVDHGIENPFERQAAGKPANGNIELSFAREGNTIVVRCKDDGGGLDYAAIRRIAEGKGMLEQEREPSPDELARLILVNGFSTREDATQISGRGVGMDVVYSRVLEMKGTLALNSQRGAGLTVELRLPATLLSAHALVVRHRDKLVAISSHGVEDIHYLTLDQIEQVGTQRMYRVGEAVHALVKIESLLDLPSDRREVDRLGFPVLLVRMDNGTTKGVLVQEVINGREVVLKNLGRYVPKVRGTIGAVILGDGSVAPVIDLVELLRAPAQFEHGKAMAQMTGMGAEAGSHAEEQDGALTALVVDDSLTARRAAAKVMQDAGYKVRTAIDGLDAVTMLQSFVPSVMVVDMEMPRMNGFELTAHVRDSARTKNVPVIMVTSRSTEKHRKMGKDAGVDVYLTKPFSDDALLDHAGRLLGRRA
jgi:chemosensory pili system protein ChpA (sensor histidine kinase/response regulator)